MSRVLGKRRRLHGSCIRVLSRGLDPVGGSRRLGGQSSYLTHNDVTLRGSRLGGKIATRDPPFYLLLGYFYLFLPNTVHNIYRRSVLVDSTRLDSTQNSNRGQTTIQLFVSFMCFCLHQESFVLLQPQPVEHYSGSGRDDIFIGLSLNTSPRQSVLWCQFSH